MNDGLKRDAPSGSGSASTSTSRDPAAPPFPDSLADAKTGRTLPGGPLSVAAICLLLAALVWAVFGQTLHFGFINFDDNGYVYDNPHISGGLTAKSVRWALTHFHEHNWHPLTTLSHMADCQIYGLQPWGHHLTNVILHGCAAIFLFLALRELTRLLWRCAFVAAVFAVHPLHVESVAWISERKDVLSGVFFALTLWAYARYARSGEPASKRRLRYATVIVCSALALMSKPTMVTLPFVLLLLDWWPLGRIVPSHAEGRPAADLKPPTSPPDEPALFANLARWRPLVVEKIPLFTMSAAVCAVTVLAQRQPVSEGFASPLVCLAGNAVVSYAVYLVQMFHPLNLSPLYLLRCDSISTSEILAACVLVSGITIVACALVNTRPWVTIGWLWYLGMLVPMIGLVRVGIQSHADRYTYLAQTGLYIALAWTAVSACRRLRAPPSVIAAISAGIIALLAMIARTQTSYWRDNESLWSHTIAVTDRNSAAYGHLGLALADKGRLDDAITQYHAALAIDPGFELPHLYLGVALQRKGDIDAAAAEYQQALLIDPDYVDALTDLAYVLANSPDNRLRNPKMAVGLAEKANRLTTGSDSVVLSTLAWAYASDFCFAEAVESQQAAIRCARGDGNAPLTAQLEQTLPLYETNRALQDAGKTR
jgi:hypothetical protein